MCVRVTKELNELMSAAFSGTVVAEGAVRDVKGGLATFDGAAFVGLCFQQRCFC